METKDSKLSKGVIREESFEEDKKEDADSTDGDKARSETDLKETSPKDNEQINRDSEVSTCKFAGPSTPASDA